MLSEDMKKFSEEAYVKISDTLADRELCKTYEDAKKLLDDKVIFERTVTHPKYGEESLSVKLTFDKDNIKLFKAMFDNKSNVITVAIPEKIFDNIFNTVENKFNWYKENAKVDREDILTSINHELVHAFDPKLKGEMGRKNFKKAVKQSKRMSRLQGLLDNGYSEELEDELKMVSDKFDLTPWEIDAFISSEAESRVKKDFANMISRGVSRKNFQKIYSTIKPSTTIEKLYYKYPKIWKRYLQHLYKLIDQKFEEA